MTDIIRETITTAGRIPAHITEGSVLRIDGRGWVEVTSKTRNEIEVIPVGALNSAFLEFRYAIDNFLLAAGWYRFLNWLEDLLARFRRKP